MVQIIQSQPTQRQSALELAGQQAIQGFGQVFQQGQQTKRQQALQALDTAIQLRGQGYDVNPEQVQQLYAQPQAGFGDVFSKRTAEFTAKQEAERAKLEREAMSQGAEIEFKKAQTEALKTEAPLKAQERMLQMQKIQADLAASPIARRKAEAEIKKLESDVASTSKSMEVPGYKNVSGFKPTEKDVEELKKLTKTTENIINASNSLKDSLKKYGVSSGLGITEGGRRVDQDLTSLQIELKNQYELGALSGPDMGLVNNAIGKISGIGAYLTPSNEKEAAIAQVQAVVEKALRNQAAAAEARGFQPVGKNTTNDSVSTGQAAQGKPRTVVQNGFTYTLNEATGQYE